MYMYVSIGIIMGQLVSTLQPEWRLRDFAPLIAVYTIVFLYITFSVGECLVDHTFSTSRKQPNTINRGNPLFMGNRRGDTLSVICLIYMLHELSFHLQFMSSASHLLGKIDLVKSKFGLGITACLTVVASLTMSLGICTFFGVSITLSGRLGILVRCGCMHVAMYVILCAVPVLRPRIACSRQLFL